MIKNKHKWLDACNVYVALWVLWYVQSLFLSSQFFSLLFYIPYFFMSIYYVAKVFTSYKPKGAMRVLCAFVLVLIIYGIALLIMDNALGQDNKSFLMMIFWSLGPIFSFYVFTKQGLLDEKRLMGWMLVFVIIVPFIFSQTRQQALMSIMEAGSVDEDATNNAAYLFTGLFPFVFLLRKRPIFQYLFIVYIFFFVVTGLKRGAMIVTSLLLVWFLFVSIKTSRTKKWGIILLSIVFMVIGYRYIVQYYEQSIFFQSRLEQTLDGDTSNRDVLYGKLWQHFRNNDNVLQVLFGEGAYHTENVTGSAKAHNDWLELLIDCGLFTTLLYAVFWLSFLRDWIRSKYNPIIYSLMGAGFIFMFMRTLFSMSFSDIPLFISMILGYSFATISNGVTIVQRTSGNE